MCFGVFHHGSDGTMPVCNLITKIKTNNAIIKIAYVRHLSVSRKSNFKLLFKPFLLHVKSGSVCDKIFDLSIGRINRIFPHLLADKLFLRSPGGVSPYNPGRASVN